MDVAVLHPQDPLRNKPSSHYQPAISHFPNMKLPNPNPKSHRCSRNRKKRTDSGPQDVSGPARPTSTKPLLNNKQQQQQLVTGQVKILKRGEQLTKTTPDPQPQTKAVSPKSPLTETKAVSPSIPLTETEDVSLTLPLTEKMEGLYAGYSMLVLSPPPSSVPLPIFITKKIAAVSDATSDLRKMLRLDFP